VVGRKPQTLRAIRLDCQVLFAKSVAKTLPALTNEDRSTLQFRFLKLRCRIESRLFLDLSFSPSSSSVDSFVVGSGESQYQQLVLSLIGSSITTKRVRL